MLSTFITVSSPLLLLYIIDKLPKLWWGDLPQATSHLEDKILS